MSIWGAVAGLAGSLYSNSQNQASAQASMDFQKEVLQNRNQWAVEDLKKAGLNPVLAAGATTSSAAGAQSTTENPGTSAASSAGQVNAMKIAQQQQKNQDAITQSQVDLNSAKAATERERANEVNQNVKESVARTGIYPAQADSFTASAESNRANAVHLKQQGEQILWNIQKMQSDLLTQEKERDLLVAQVKNAHTQADRNRAETALAQAETKVSQLKQATQAEYTKGQQIANQLQELNVPKAKNKATYEDQAFGHGLKGAINRDIRGLIDTFRGR